MQSFLNTIKLNASRFKMAIKVKPILFTLTLRRQANIIFDLKVEKNLC